MIFYLRCILESLYPPRDQPNSSPTGRQLSSAACDDDNPKRRGDTEPPPEPPDGTGERSNCRDAMADSNRPGKVNGFIGPVMEITVQNGMRKRQLGTESSPASASLCKMDDRQICRLRLHRRQRFTRCHSSRTLRNAVAARAGLGAGCLCLPRAPQSKHIANCYLITSRDRPFKGLRAPGTRDRVAQGTTHREIVLLGWRR